MGDPQLIPHKITKPIQLLAAWFAGLTLVNASFLVGAGTIHEPQWIPALLTVAAVLNVPLFIVGLFLLQTRFRPEMQEDSFYAKYLERKSSTPSPRAEPVDLDNQLRNLADEIVSKLSPTTRDPKERVVEILKESEISELVSRFAGSRTLSELHMYHSQWGDLVDDWEDSPSFKDDLSVLVQAGLVTLEGRDKRNAQLTPVGGEVARRLEAQNRLWNQLYKRHMRDDS